MKTISDPAAFHRHCRALKADNASLALVPTMGYLHDGHLSLMDEAARRADISVATIFVNPAQFGPGEDLDAYPRALERDAELAKAHGINVLFTPKAEDMYFPDHATWIDVPTLGQGLCGASRPGHFRGVCTVVCKLLNLAMPDYAVFGQKDWQQLAILRRMVRDLMIPVELIGMPIVREDDGLALSSRNVYLTDEERNQAPNIHAGMKNMAEAVKRGEKNADTLLGKLGAYYEEMLPAATVDYMELVHPDSLQPVEIINNSALIAVALKMSKARLIDNFLLEV